MPQIPTYENLGPAQLGGAARPAQIPEQAATELGRVAWHVQAFNHIASTFEGVAQRAQQTENETWLSNAKINTLQQTNDLTKGLSMSAGPDGSGMEQFGPQYKQIADESAKGAPSDKMAASYMIWAAEHGMQQGQVMAQQQQQRYKTFVTNGLSANLDTLTTLTKVSPGLAEQNYQVYSDKIDALRGKAFTTTEATQLKEEGRAQIQKAKVLSNGEANPKDWFLALQGLKDGQEAQSKQSGLPVSGPSTQENAPIEASPQDRDIMIRTILGEAGNQSDEGKKAVGSVILNRYRAGYASTIAGVAQKHDTRGTYQFEPWMDRNSAAYTTSPGSPDYQATGKLVDSLLAGEKSNVGTATHFYSPAAQAALGRKPPSWASTMKPEGQVDAHQFFTDTSKMWAPSMAIAQGIDLSKLPKIEGSTIQPADIASLAPKDYDAMERTLRPSIAVSMDAKMKAAVSDTLHSGTQNVIGKDDMDVMKAVLGPKPYQKYMGQLDSAQEQWAVNQTVQAMTSQQQQDWLQTLRPTSEEGTGSAAEWEAYRRAGKSVYDFRTQFKKSPFAYITQSTDLGQQAMKVFSDAPQGPEGTALREHALDMIAQAQRDQGLPASDVEVMPKLAISDTVARLASAQSGEEAVGILNSARTTYGKYFSQFWRDAVHAGAPEGLQAASLATNKGQTDLVDAYRIEKQLADAEGKGGNRKTILALKAGSTERDIKQAVATETQDFTAALDPRSPAEISAVQQAVEKVALRAMLVNGKDRSDAVSYAVQEIYGKNYAVHGGAIVPRDLWESSDGTALRRGLDHVDTLLEQEGPNILASRRSDPLRLAENSRRDYLDALDSSFRLQTAELAPGSNRPAGINVIDQHGNPVMTKDGKGAYSPLVLPWERLIGHGQAYSPMNRLRRLPDELEPIAGAYDNFVSGWLGE